ncbi:MAG TPA: hypothetical protein VGG25_02640 [Streptosporangiaceae bacterium]|jgi:hypothetical protein
MTDVRRRVRVGAVLVVSVVAAVRRGLPVSAGAEHGECLAHRGDDEWSKCLLAWVQGLNDDERRGVLAYLAGYAPDTLETVLCEVVGPDHPAASHD